MEMLKLILSDELEKYYSKCESTGTEFNSFICAGIIIDLLLANNLIDNRQITIIEIKECIADILSKERAYCDMVKIAENLYDRGFRLCHEKRA